LNFTERGFGVRAAVGCSDRGHTAVSQLKPGQIDWGSIFGKGDPNSGARWFHTGGLFCALSETSPEVAIEAMRSARRNGVIVSYDLNYRDSLWASFGGKKQAQLVNRRIAPFVDVVLGNEEDFSAELGYEIPGMDESLSNFHVDGFKSMIEKVVKDFPFSVVATTLRKAKTATINDWDAICYCAGRFYEARHRENLEILDRVGGGDSFAA
jgi:2-dehydro-3-deoxygluconokinase